MRYAIPLHALNYVVGINGEVIRRLAHDFQVYVKLSPVEVPGLDERIYLINGASFESVQYASLALFRVLAQDPNK
jgi:hypothetical protein